MSYTPPPPPPEHGDSGDQPGSPPPPPPPGYGGPGYGAPKNSSKAVAALVIGIISPVVGLCCAVIGLVGIAAIVLGRSAQKEIAASNGALTGEGMAKAGVILGIIGCVVAVATTILNVALLLTGNTTFDFNTVR